MPYACLSKATFAHERGAVADIPLADLRRPYRVNFLYASLVGRSAASPIRRRLSSS